VNLSNRVSLSVGDHRNGKNGPVPIDALRDSSVPLNLVGSALSNADFIALEARWVNRELAEAAFLRRVDSFTGAQLVGRKGGDYSGIAIPYVSPGSPYVREYRLRRDHPDFEAGANGELRVKQKYLSPPGRGNMLYLPPGCDPALLHNAALPLILTEGEFKTLALWRLATTNTTDGPRFLPVGIAGVFNWRGTIAKVTAPKPHASRARDRSGAGKSNP
jgi:hypothetical protein